jgi:hypothetical protein
VRRAVREQEHLLPEARKAAVVEVVEEAEAVGGLRLRLRLEPKT